MDLRALRDDTPGVRHRVHLNNAGASLIPRPVLAAVRSHLDREAEIGGYEAAAEALQRIEGVYRSIARLIGAEPDEIALTENATVAWQMAFYAQRFRPGERILTARAEYAANFVAFLQVARRTGAVIDVVPDDAHGALDIAALEAMLDERVKLIAITWVPTNGGLVNPAAAVGALARSAAFPICSMRARRWARCQWMSRCSAATCCPRLAGNICAGPAAPAFSTSGVRCLKGWSRR